MEVIRILFLQKFWEVLHSIRILCLRVMFVGIWFFHKDEFDLLRIWREIRWNCFCHEKWTIVRCECFSLLRWSLIHFSLILAANKNPKQINISVRRVKWNLFQKNTLGFHLQPKMGNGYSNKWQKFHRCQVLPTFVCVVSSYIKSYFANARSKT